MNKFGKFSATLVVIGCALASFGEDWYVSDDMTYGEGIVSAGHRTNDLDAACAKATSGTIWVKDGFVCQSGGGRSRDGASRILVPRSVIVRSESGYVDEANGKGATIRGEYDMTVGPEGKYIGDNSMRCAAFSTAGGSAKLIGFVLERGSSNYTHDNTGGGGVHGGTRDHVVSNCVIRNCYARRGGGASSVGVYGSVISNCFAKLTGGGCANCTIRDSQICNNRAETTNQSGGGCGNNCYVSNCVVCCNYCTNQGGGCGGCTVIDCIITNNATGGWGGGVSGKVHATARGKTIIAFNSAGRGGGVNVGDHTYSNLIVHSNVAKGGDGGGFYNFNGGNNAHLWNCVVSNNTITSDGNGGAAFRVKSVTKSLIVGNSTAPGYNGGGLYQVPLVDDCILVGNVAKQYGGGLYSCPVCSNITLIGNSATQRGGGACDSKIYGGTVVSNKTTGTGQTTYGGGGMYGGYAERMTFEYNTVPDNGGGGAARDTALYDCMVRNNSAGRYGGGLCGGSSTNCTFVFNVEGPNGSVGAGGGAVQGGTHYNALFLNNSAANYGSAAYSATCYNCTAFSNTNTRVRETWSGGCFSECKLVNCLSYGNVGGGDDGVTWASNSCLQVSSVASDKYVNCTNVNPWLDAEFRPHARACKHTGLFFDWMTDEADVRSKDLAGNPRIADGAEKPNMGCYESLPIGLMLLLR